MGRKRCWGNDPHQAALPFYDPEGGHVMIDGHQDFRKLSTESLRRQTTVLFQELASYHDTVFNNIAFGDIDSKPDPARIETAARAAVP